MLRTLACRGCTLLRGAPLRADAALHYARRTGSVAYGSAGKRAMATSLASSQTSRALEETADVPEGLGAAGVPVQQAGGSSAQNGSAPAASAPASARLSNRRARIAPIKLTDRAADRIKELISGRDNVIGVRLGVKRRGCNGLSYTMNYAETKPKFDEEVNEKGVVVFIDPMALMHIVGTVMDFEETELSSEFTFNNPNAKGKCGCGESFSV